MLKSLMPLLQKLLARPIAREATRAMDASAPVTGRALGKMRQELADSTGGALDIEEATITQTPDGASVQARVRAQRRVENLRAVREEARENVRTENIDPEPLDPDWESQFIDYARDVSSEDLRKIWARILSRELEKPGRTTLRTLSVLKNLSGADARAYVELTRYRIGGFIVHGCIGALDQENLFVTLLDAGLLHPPPVAPQIETDDSGWHQLGDHGNHNLLIQGPPKTGFDNREFPAASLTLAGRELAFLCPAGENREYLACVARALAKKQCVLWAAPMRRSPRGGREYNIETMRKIDPSA